MQKNSRNVSESGKLSSRLNPAIQYFLRAITSCLMPQFSLIGLFPSSPRLLYQNDVKCSAFDMEMICNSQANKTHFHKKGCSLGLILKVRVLELGGGPFY